MLEVKRFFSQYTRQYRRQKFAAKRPRKSILDTGKLARIQMDCSAVSRH
jgi:hypothetical protein